MDTMTLPRIVEEQSGKNVFGESSDMLGSESRRSGRVQCNQVELAWITLGLDSVLENNYLESIKKIQKICPDPKLYEVWERETVSLDMT